MKSGTMFFSNSAESKEMMKESGYFHISDVLEMMEMARDHPRLEGLEGQEKKEALIDLVLSEEWKVGV